MFNYTITDLSSGQSKHETANSTSEALVSLISKLFNIHKDCIEARKIPAPRGSGKLFLVIGKDYMPHFYDVNINQTKVLNKTNNTLSDFMYLYSKKIDKIEYVNGVYHLKSWCRGGNDYDDAEAMVGVGNGVINYKIHTPRGAEFNGTVGINELDKLYSLLSKGEVII